MRITSQLLSIVPDLKQGVRDAVLDPKIALGVSGGTAGAGATEWYFNIPWPAIVTGTGFCFSILFGIIQLWRFILDRKKNILVREKLRIDKRIRLLEEEILKQKIHDRTKG